MEKMMKPKICPEGHAWGEDNDKYPKDCKNCPVWDDCFEDSFDASPPKKAKPERNSVVQIPVQIDMREAAKVITNIVTARDIREVVIEKVLRMAKCERFIVTGSYALYRMGLIETVHDIDIILVNPDKTTKDILLFWQKEFPAQTKAPEKSELFSIFMLNGTKVDVFVQSNFREKTIETTHGYELACAKWIIKAKKSHNRLKDWLQLKKMSEMFFSQSAFDLYIQTTPISQITGTNEY